MAEAYTYIGDNVSGLTDREVAKVIREIDGDNLVEKLILRHLDLLTRSV